jgi:hypothetical protein
MTTNDRSWAVHSQLSTGGPFIHIKFFDTSLDGGGMTDLRAPVSRMACPTGSSIGVMVFVSLLFTFLRCNVCEASVGLQADIFSLLIGSCLPLHTLLFIIPTTIKSQKKHWRSTSHFVFVGIAFGPVGGSVKPWRAEQRDGMV